MGGYLKTRARRPQHGTSNGVGVSNVIFCQKLIFFSFLSIVSFSPKIFIKSPCNCYIKLYNYIQSIEILIFFIHSIKISNMTCVYKLRKIVHPQHLPLICNFQNSRKKLISIYFQVFDISI